MSNKTPFELRFDIFQQAKEILLDEYQAKREELLHQYEMEEETFYPDMPEYPSFDSIVKMAREINHYVSNS